jgi:hypothetical protein
LIPLSLIKAVTSGGVISNAMLDGFWFGASDRVLALEKNPGVSSGFR